MSMIFQWLRLTPGEAEDAQAMPGDALFEWMDAHDDRVVEVDKAWHGIHAVLTGTAWEVEGPLSTIVLGGAEFGEDLGYGPPRLLPRADVAAAAAAVEPVTPATFRERIDFGRLQQLEIYPTVWDRVEEHDELRSYLTDGFDAVRTLFLDAAAAGDAIAIVCT